MAEKRVSVRLAAVGGKQVRAELEGVGDAGVKGFGRMSKEAEIANARLAAFSTRVKLAAAVAVAAAVAAGIAMIRSGLETIDALLSLWPIFEAFNLHYVSRGMLLDAEKNGFAPLPTGSSAGATVIAKPVKRSARTAPRD